MIIGATLYATALTCMALNVYYEARSEPYIGQVAVAEVVLNRAHRDVSMACDTIWKPAQFAWTSRYSTMGAALDGVKEHGAFVKAVQVASDVMFRTEWDITGGATHFHADYVHPWWAPKLQRLFKVGHHIFYKAKPKLMPKPKAAKPEVPFNIEDYGGVVRRPPYFSTHVFKAAYYTDLDGKRRHCIIVLGVPASSRVHIGFDKCRTDRAYVVGWQTLRGQALHRHDVKKIPHSYFDFSFKYPLNRWVTPKGDRYSTRDMDCAEGIHFFLVRSHAVSWARLG